MSASCPRLIDRARLQTVAQALINVNPGSPPCCACPQIRRGALHFCIWRNAADPVEEIVTRAKKGSTLARDWWIVRAMTRAIFVLFLSVNLVLVGCGPRGFITLVPTAKTDAVETTV
ncbi:unnamed protein product, partial [Chrysoparadoxa australica]